MTTHILSFLSLTLLILIPGPAIAQTGNIPPEVLIRPMVDDGQVLPEEITSPTDGALMRLIPAGEFEMGDHFNEGTNDDLPVHTVYLDAFYIDVFEVTNARYKMFMEATGHRAPEHWDDAQYNQPDQPVVGVNWNDVARYTQWANKSLPTEAEWEKAARGGLVGKRYVWGDSSSPPAGAGNLADETAKREFPGWKIFEGYDDGYARTAPVGSFSPNGYGLHDMEGNVWEWCMDEYNSSFYTTSPRNNPVAGGPRGFQHDNVRGVVGHRPLRGGSWFDFPFDVPVAHRRNYNTVDTQNFKGFRCAGRELPPVPSVIRPYNRGPP